MGNGINDPLLDIGSLGIFKAHAVLVKHMLALRAPS